jgi:hypothetical protein
VSEYIPGIKDKRRELLDMLAREEFANSMADAICEDGELFMHMVGMLVQRRHHDHLVEALDAMVHDAFNARASDVNNRGASAQLTFLLTDEDGDETSLWNELIRVYREE